MLFRSDTRAIVFTQFRSSVSEIVEALQAACSERSDCDGVPAGALGTAVLVDRAGLPLIRAAAFIGQAAGAAAAKGQTQKQQGEVIARFRRGEMNVIVATCIGEEGLDIGDVCAIPAVGWVFSRIWFAGGPNCVV